MHARVLASLIKLGPGVRGALLALASDSGLALGLLDAVRESWPEEIPAKAQATAASRRALRGQA